MRLRALACAALVALAASCCACGGPDKEPEGPVPALSRAGSKWQATRGDRKVFTMTNEPGVIRWTQGETEHPFLTGAVADPREDARLRRLVKQSRHFRDLVHRLERAGYGVAPAEAPLTP